MARFTISKFDVGAPLRIAQVSPYDFAIPGGVTTHITNLTEQFRSMGHKVDIIAPSSSVATESDVYGFHRVGKTIVPLRSNASIARVSFSLTLAPHVRRILRAGNFDVVHIHEPLAPLLPWYVLWFSNAVNVGTFHASREKSTVYRTYRQVVKHLQGKLHGRIAVSLAARDFVHAIFPEEYHIIPNGIDPERYGTRTPEINGLSDGKFNIVFLGRPEKRKGLPVLLQAMQLVQRLRTGVRLIVVGACSDRQHQKLVKRVSKLGIQEVLFAGFVSEEDKLRYLQSAHVLVAPARSGGRESQGLVLLEAMAAGTPVIASDIKGYRTVSPKGEAALYVEPDDHRALARAILRMIDHPDTRDRYRASGLACAKKFSWDVIGKNICDYYHELLSEQKAKF